MDSRVGTTFGKYSITRLLGQGGMGEVYEAFDADKNRTVALKILADQYSNDAIFRTRFQRESHAAAVLQEPHVIPIHDWGEIDGSLYIDMRLVQGATLSDLIADGPLEPARAVAITTQIAAALDAAHAAGLIHRDIKPQNIIVTPADFAYLVDFGIAESQGDSRLTTEGSRIGTMNYMAPERFTGQTVTPAVDSYSLACVLYEALTGHPPFAGDNLESLLAAHISAPPPRPSVANPAVPTTLDDVVVRGMAKDPDDRYGSAGALGRAAQRALQAGSAPSTLPHQAPTLAAAVSGPHADQPVEPTQPESRRRNWVLPTIIAVAAALILGVLGVVIGMLAGNLGQPADTPPSATGKDPAQAAGPLPPLVTGPDQSSLHQTCDDGFAATTASGFGSRAGRGTPETSCLFTNSVLTSYWAEYGNASPLPRAVSAPGAVDCGKVPGALCDGSNFLMHCQQSPGDSWITCTGGKNARVYLW
ncbi:serine/threonine protein kinase [Mycolicibacterium fortuitum subsp. fortuitum DSM 46621 = ATCC 6841 = JCM 6387]|uniref:non-specific serine/threonine protein kinase n=2 Tax=Mycolicibacterium fortuitum TaxID=1766 RepID=K0V733_MYCFO|nr:serine/threonine-protein kinase [Mycolicibacterium fortuitum]AIY48041.1 putative serine/threonine-protein kinase pknH [Mycobacterium sp. VKM Ac-1817D]CRL74076.1 serine/threonine protein kinase [Mycolicibacter nonchromogenicus]EJZ10628.1 serine/threonine protein kinase [Mycolicibacterium fortuitum subsp. fortuitum DSM 46621 = ATCC 6841 = JCM 6387]WEV31654.1 protein kinase [Mycolicibacterium fortuitum]CRL58225.1 serine/threonine protein kinase [Mycolicibacterium fortuitum subsp. fortuitum DSM